MATLLTVGILEVLVGLTLLTPTLWMGASEFSAKYITHTRGPGYVDFSDLALLLLGSATPAFLAPVLGGLASVLTAVLLKFPTRRAAQLAGAVACIVVPGLVGVVALLTPFVISGLQPNANGTKWDFAAAIGVTGAAFSTLATALGVFAAGLVVWTHRRAALSLDAPLPD